MTCSPSTVTTSGADSRNCSRSAGHPSSTPHQHRRVEPEPREIAPGHVLCTSQGEASPSHSVELESLDGRFQAHDGLRTCVRPFAAHNTTCVRARVCACADDGTAGEVGHWNEFPRTRRRRTDPRLTHHRHQLRRQLTASTIQRSTQHVGRALSGRVPAAHRPVAATRQRAHIASSTGRRSVRRRVSRRTLRCAWSGTKPTAAQPRSDGTLSSATYVSADA